VGNNYDAGQSAANTSVRSRFGTATNNHVSSDSSDRTELVIDLNAIEHDRVIDADELADLIYLPGAEGGRLGAASKTQLAVKRTIDIVLTTIALIALAPIMTLVAAIIKLGSPGPILHRQTRIGQDGTPFTFLKFRSMYVDAETRRFELADHNEATGPIFKIKDDPRITGIGRFIRKYSIDETPQLLHVIPGRLSLVGPRPHLPEEVAAYQGLAHRRLAVKPGITGIWQVSGRSNLDFETWIKLDLQYLDTWSLALDLKLLAKTLTAVITGKGAY
jgi:lipopolysaccharide/colanic/teichoic acid biosynthesis glycosyltransferase